MKDDLKADWSYFEKRAPWYTVTSRELAKVLSVSLQTINNWKMRNVLPAPEPSHSVKGNVNRYKISKIRAWLENRTENEINIEFIEGCMDIPWSNITLSQAQDVAKLCYEILEIERPPI